MGLRFEKCFVKKVGELESANSMSLDRLVREEEECLESRETEGGAIDIPARLGETN